MKNLLNLVFISVLLFSFSSCATISKNFSNYSNGNEYFKKGISTITFKNDSKDTIYFAVEDSITPVLPKKKLKIDLPYGFYDFSLNEFEFEDNRIYGKCNYTILASMNGF